MIQRTIQTRNRNGIGGLLPFSNISKYIPLDYTRTGHTLPHFASECTMYIIVNEITASVEAFRIELTVHNTHAVI